MTEACISIQGVTKTFGETRAVDALDLVVPRGSLCGFLGPNGAGKTTTIRMVMSIIYPDAGSVSVLGGSALASKDRIGYLPEERGVYRKMRVAEFLEYIARLKGCPRRGLRESIARWLKRVDLPEVGRQRCQELSKGMQQKVQFVAACIHEPDLLILDEPFSGLDPVNANLVNTLIRELRDAGTTIIFSTHVLHQAEQICDRFFLIDHGRKLLDATLDEIHERFDPRTILVEPLEGADLAAIEGIRETRPIEGERAVEVEVDDGRDPQEVMRAILAAGPCRRLELRRVSLDDAFVRLVRENAGEQQALRAREELRA